MLGGAVGVATATGPVLGGAIIGLGGEDLGWRLTFLVNVPVGIASFVLCRSWLPADRARGGTPRPLDLTGAGLLALGVFALLLPAVRYDSSRDPRLAYLLLPAAAVLAAFVLWERGPAARSGYPLIDLGLFRIRSYSDGLGVALLYFAAFTGTPLVLSLFLQEGLGFSALRSGLTASSFAVGAAVSALVGGRLVNRYGGRLLVGALGLFVVGVLGAVAVVLTLAGGVPDDRLALLLAGPLLVAGLGGGSVITPNQTLSLAEVDSVGGSTAGGMLQTAQRVGSSLGTAVISAVFYAGAAAVVVTAGSEDATGFGRAYATSLLVAVGFSLAALALALRSVRRRPAA